MANELAAQPAVLPARTGEATPHHAPAKVVVGESLARQIALRWAALHLTVRSVKPHVLRGVFRGVPDSLHQLKLTGVLALAYLAHAFDVLPSGTHLLHQRVTLLVHLPAPALGLRRVTQPGHQHRHVTERGVVLVHRSLVPTLPRQLISVYQHHGDVSRHHRTVKPCVVVHQHHHAIGCRHAQPLAVCIVGVRRIHFHLGTQLSRGQTVTVHEAPHLVHANHHATLTHASGAPHGVAARHHHEVYTEVLVTKPVRLVTSQQLHHQLEVLLVVYPHYSLCARGLFLRSARFVTSTHFVVHILEFMSFLVL